MTGRRGGKQRVWRECFCVVPGQLGNHPEMHCWQEFVTQLECVVVHMCT